MFHVSKGTRFFQTDVRFRNVNNFIYLYTNFYKYTNMKDFFKLFNDIYNFELIMSISIEDTINIWLSNTRLVSNFSIYSGKLFTLIGEYTDTEKFFMELD
jgi:hypothetical protein